MPAASWIASFRSLASIRQRLAAEQAAACGELLNAVGAFGVVARRPVFGVEVYRAEVLHSAAANSASFGFDAIT
jgi:hypothetical protein